MSIFAGGRIGRFSALAPARALKTILHLAPSLALTAALAGCGTAVPSIQEPPSQSVDSVQLVSAITQSTVCELHDAVSAVIQEDKQLSIRNNNPRVAQWFEDKWGVQVGLTITVQEKSTLNPSVAHVTPVPATHFWNVGGSLLGSTTATRVGVINYFYTIKELYNKKDCSDDFRKELPGGSFLIRSDLKTKEWLRAQLTTAALGIIKVPIAGNTPLGQNALSHEVKFQVVTSADISPKLTLVNTTFNGSAPLFAGSRDRTHSMLATFGPLNATASALSDVPSQLYFARQISSAIRDAELR